MDKLEGELSVARTSLDIFAWLLFSISQVQVYILLYFSTDVFACSGKTYSMLGPGFDGSNVSVANEAVLADPGLIPRVMQSLFAKGVEIESENKGSFTFRASYIEIYLEQVKDLLNPNTANENSSLDIRSDKENGLQLPDATEVPLYNLLDVFDLLRRGAKHRKVAATSKQWFGSPLLFLLFYWDCVSCMYCECDVNLESNAFSSRSHAIFIVTVSSRQSAGVTKTSQLYLCDLAGSEKVKKTEVEGLQLTEAAKINRGLLALGNVISQLCLCSNLPPQKRPHIPYRDSKLTRLLQNCIGGNAHTSLIINCSPSEYNAPETLSTLRFW